MTQPNTQPKPTGVLTIAKGVALGLLVVLVLLFVIFKAAGANDGAECALDNAERANLGLSARDCG